jgi:hypothetical protein
MMPSGIAGARDASPAENKYPAAQRRYGDAMRFRQAQLPAGLEPLEFGEIGRIAVVTGSGSKEERWQQQRLGIWHSKSVWRKGGS